MSRVERITNSQNQPRRTGILLHPSSLPGMYGNGDIGLSAYHFIDFLKSCGCTVWQMLPLGPTHSDGSPYLCLSVHAGNPQLISIDWLVNRDWLDLSTVNLTGDGQSCRVRALKQAYEKFNAVHSKDQWRKKYNTFVKQHKDWLEDYALFIALKKNLQGEDWFSWPDELRDRNPQALAEAARDLADSIDLVRFEQFVFFTQWHELKDYAAEQGVLLFGDIPIFVSHDSVDVWAYRKNFLIDECGQASVVAGVPPDAFSETGQRWGNPLYDWKAMQADGFSWWMSRFTTQHELFDLVRIDHFRGLQACWQIPAEEDTAIKGQWVEVPGKQLLETLSKKFTDLTLVAEDLGLITQAVYDLRDRFSLPGMKVLQFAFGDNSRNPYLPHNYSQNSVVYTGTHDNDTTLGWYQSLDKYSLRRLNDYLACPAQVELDMPWVMIRLALASVANLAIIPMQDILSLDSLHRMNTPGTTEGNWRWRFEWTQIWPSLANDLWKMNASYGRLVNAKE
ncbi:MAG: 4-alpha-glucanotransferase [Gammaproteobacteria bacterium]|nr:4-alpha-glucanotransferase [Gammaproteobacteria bacterium]